MASAEQSSIENLQTLLSEEVLHTVQNYFEIKIVHENGGSLFFFLHNRVHELFHYFVKQTPCCYNQTPCASIENKGTLTKDQFDLLYYNDPSVQPVHEKKDKERILLHCICAISPNQDIDVSDLDFTLINCLVKTCHNTPAGNPKWLKDILEVRNRLSHLGDRSCITEHQIQSWWMKLENASISIAGTIGIVYQKGVRKRISKLKKSQSHLDELMKALKTRDDEMEKKILSALENMGVKTAGVCFRVTTVEFTREQPKTTLTAPVVTPCNDPKKCTVVWKFSDAGEWDVKEMQKKLECISIIGDFNIEFVYQGCLIVYTTAERYILADVDAFKDATEEFLWLFRKRLGKLIVESDCSINVAISIWDHNKHGSPFDQKEDFKVMCAKKSTSDDYLMAVAIDFGTAYSGYAFSMRSEFKSDPSKIHANTAWISGGRSLLSLKAPTCLLLDEKKEFVAFGYDAENKFSDIVLDEDEDESKYYFFHRFKMNLYHRENINSKMVIEDIQGKPVLATHVFSLSIKAMLDHLYKTLETQGINIKRSEIKWVLTVPAVWSDPAKAIMRKSAELAGIPDNKLFIALEPEAASIYCQYIPTSVKEGETLKKPGTKYLVVDLGGGTADLTAHESLPGGKLKEICSASGDACGGTSVDQKFFQLLTKILGGPAVKTLKEEAPDAYLDLFREFEVVKRTVGPKQTDKVNMTVPYVALDEICQRVNNESFKDVIKSSVLQSKITLRGDKIRIDPDLIRDLFSETIKKIKPLIAVTLDKVKGISHILLVGGFAECHLVQHDIRKEFANMMIACPSESSLTVLKGAVLFGHQHEIIESRIMKYSYGIARCINFDKTVHDEKHMVILEGVRKCDNVFRTLMTKNQSVSVGTVVSKTCSTNKKNQNGITFRLFASTESSPMYTLDESCFSIGEKRFIINDPDDGFRHFDEEYTFGDTEIFLKIVDQKNGEAQTATFQLPE